MNHRHAVPAMLVMALAACAPKAEEAAPAEAASSAPLAIPASLSGTWASTTMIGPTDSVVATPTVIIGTDGTMRIVFTGRTDTVPTRLVRVSEDSLGVDIVVEAGPYPSGVRAGVDVTTRLELRYTGETGIGSWSGAYSDGQTLTGKLATARQR